MTLLTSVAALVALDQVTKLFAIERLQHTRFQPLHYLGGLFRVQYAENPGAFLSLMADWPPHIRFWVLTVANGVILGGLAVYLVRSRTVDRWMWFALMLILAGGIGNLIDRVRFDGHVIDFLNIGVGRLRTGIFNVADVAITAGFLMLLPRAFLPEKKPAACAPAVEEAAS
jgi:signal peptidase II